MKTKTSSPRESSAVDTWGLLRFLQWQVKGKAKRTRLSPRWAAAVAQS
ncbi:hypothetical protein [Labrys miyagiensis]|nr:hypothetical protein [Labrys miyagiensis]